MEAFSHQLFLTFNNLNSEENLALFSFTPLQLAFQSSRSLYFYVNQTRSSVSHIQVLKSHGTRGSACLNKAGKNVETKEKVSRAMETQNVSESYLSRAMKAGPQA